MTGQQNLDADDQRAIAQAGHDLSEQGRADYVLHQGLMMYGLTDLLNMAEGELPEVPSPVISWYLDTGERFLERLLSDDYAQAIDAVDLPKLMAILMFLHHEYERYDSGEKLGGDL